MRVSSSTLIGVAGERMVEPRKSAGMTVKASTLRPVGR